MLSQTLSLTVTSSESTDRVYHRGFEALVEYATCLNAQQETHAVCKLLAEQTHRSFAPAPAIVWCDDAEGFEVRSLVSQDESVAAGLRASIKMHSEITERIRRALIGRNHAPFTLRVSHLTGLQVNGFEVLFCAPFKTPRVNGAVAILLTNNEMPGENDASFMAALAGLGGLAISNAIASQAAAAFENSQLFARITRSSRQWAEIFDSISDFMLLHDENQRVVRVNRSLADKLKKLPAELLGMQVRDLLGQPADAPACPFCVDLQSEQFKEEFRDPRNGDVYLVSSSRLRGGVEDVQQIVHVLKDVTASRRAERLYRELFDNIQEGAYFATADGRMIQVNDALVRMLGYDSREELLSVDASRLYVDPALRELTKRALHQFGRLRNHELALLRRDGSIIYALENSFVVRDDNGQVVEYRGVLLDITEMKHVQSQLLREHDFNTQILNHTQSLIAVVDTAGLVSYANRRCCEVSIGPAGENILIGSRLETIVAESHRDHLRQALHSVMEGRPINNLELPLTRGRNVIGSFSVNLSPMRNTLGEVNSIVAVMTDITDVATLQAKLMHAEKMAAVGQLVSGVAHEVNNPLTAILGFADLLLENPELADEVKSDLQIIVQEAQRTREIVQNLLSFARQTPPEKHTVDINQVLRKTISLRSYDLGSHGIVLEEAFDPNLPGVVGDAHQLQQVFLNILNNACDAVEETGRRGRIIVATEVVGTSIEIRFQDNGTGIKHADRIFDPFYTTKEVGKGTGLGLSICYGIVREHSGEIVCFNNPDVQGATFCIRLPLCQQASAKKNLAKAVSA